MSPAPPLPPQRADFKFKFTVSTTYLQLTLNVPSSSVALNFAFLMCIFSFLTCWLPAQCSSLSYWESKVGSRQEFRGMYGTITHLEACLTHGETSRNCVDNRKTTLHTRILRKKYIQVFDSVGFFKCCNILDWSHWCGYALFFVWIRIWPSRMHWVQLVDHITEHIFIPNQHIRV